MILNIKRNLFAITFILLIFSSIVSAEEITVCESMGLSAETIMGARQAGLPLSEIMDMIPDDNVYHETMALWAYEEPVWSTSDNQEKAKREFRDKIELACYKGLKK